MDTTDIQCRADVVQDYVHGDDDARDAIFSHYRYIAEESWPYVLARTQLLMQYDEEDIAQQAYVILYDILEQRVYCSERPGFYEIKKCGCCLGLRPFLITTVRQEVKKFLIQGGLIKTHYHNFSNQKVEKYGKPRVHRVISMYQYANGEEFILPGAVPIVIDDPAEMVAYREILKKLQLTAYERAILKLRGEGRTLDETAQILGITKKILRTRIERIQRRYGKA
jgi:hypothetical protein